ncbi:transmembrane protein 130 [Lissotriton helveticus]
MAKDIQKKQIKDSLLASSDSEMKHVLEIHADDPITTGAQATVTATVRVLGGNSISMEGHRPYHFHWIHTPLVLTAEYENTSSSEIKLLAKSPGNYSISVWVTRTGCHSCPPIAKNFTQIQITDSLLGELKIIQEKNVFTRHRFHLATGKLIQIAFLLYDPSSYLKSASFSYGWDFGDGYQLITEEPSVHYNYSTPGAYAFHLTVVAEIEASSRESYFVQKTGYFSADLQLLDPVTGIQVKGSTQVLARKTFSLLLHVIGSPPLSLCWLLKLECVPAEGDDCHLLALNATDYTLSYKFNYEGEYCLSVRAQNDISMLQTYYNITVKSAAVYPTLFVLPCAAVILMILCFIGAMMFRSSQRHHRLHVEVADFDFSPSSEKNPSLQGPGGIQVNNSCTLQPSEGDKQKTREKHPLLKSLYKARSYML